MRFLNLCLLLALSVPAYGNPLPIIPKPTRVTADGSRFPVRMNFTFHCEGDELQAVTGLCGELLGKRFPALGAGKPATEIVFTKAGVPERLGSEGYLLDITGPDKIMLRASQPAGHLHAFQSLLQLLPADRASAAGATLPVARIEDRPRFSWRGMHLDESRHFFGKEFIKRYLDILASYKMNVFHWHLVDDGGWRIEIKKYPRLTEVGAWRSKMKWDVRNLSFPRAEDGSIPTSGLYGGFHTQDDIREIVAYAAARHIRVIPEIEMPGHSLPALAAYPQLACRGDLKDDGEGWTPSSQNSYCAGHDGSYQFLEDVLAEVFALFPDKDVHIGGDEVIKAFWNQCPRCEKRMKSEQLANTSELQSYFIRRMEKFINSHGRNLIGWDEITHGGLAPNATVMFWIGMGAVPETVRAGHDVIMTPMTPCYFDYGYDSNSTEKVYQWEPVPEEFRGDPLEKKILGAQGNVWTEGIEDGDRVEYMVLPRLLAMAETLWTSPENKNLDSFLSRLDHHYGLLDAAGYNYRFPTPRPLAGTYLFTDKTEVSFAAPPAGFQLRFTNDGGEPGADSPEYQAPVSISGPCSLRAALFKDGRAGGETRVDCVRFRPRDMATLAPGLKAEYAEGEWKRIPDFATLPEVRRSVVAVPDLSIRKRDDHFACRFSGYIRIPGAGVHGFTLASDDGSRLRIGGATVVDHDGPHGYSAKSGSVFLQAGIYPIEIGYLEVSENERLDLTITTPDGETGPLPAEILFHSTAPDFSSAAIRTSLPGDKDHGPSNLLDGNRNTMFWISRHIKKDETITLTLPVGIPAGSVLVLRDGLDNGGDRFDGGVIEASPDGRRWKTIGSSRSGVLSATTTHACRYFRLRATRDIGHWVALRELELVDAPPVGVRTGKVRAGGKSIPLSVSCALEDHPDLAPAFEQIAGVFFKAWPRLVELLGVPVDETPRDIDVRLAADMDHPAHASGNTIVISAAHLKRDPGDTIGVFIHELTHIVQRYPVGQPGWFIEGSADYTRFLLNPGDNWAKWNREHIAYDKPFGAYWSSAAFLLYLESTCKKPIVVPVSQAIRKGEYSDGIWKSLTGKSLDQLAADYKESAWKPE